MRRRRDLAALLVPALLVVAACAAEAPPEVLAGGGRFTEAVALPPPSTAGGPSLQAVLAARRSQRSFAPEALTPTTIGQLLWAGQGTTGQSGGRTAPSAGALYPIELYVVTADEVQHYLPAGHRLETRPSPDLRPALQAAAFDQPAVGSAPAVMVVAAVPARTAAKYGPRAEAYVDREAGHVAQNLLLQATGLDLAAVPVGGFDPSAVARTLLLPLGHDARYLVPVGHPAA